MDGASCCRTKQTGEWKEEKTGGGDKGQPPVVNGLKGVQS